MVHTHPVSQWLRHNRCGGCKSVLSVLIAQQKQRSFTAQCSDCGSTALTTNLTHALSHREMHTSSQTRQTHSHTVALTSLDTSTTRSSLLSPSLSYRNRQLIQSVCARPQLFNCVCTMRVCVVQVCVNTQVSARCVCVCVCVYHSRIGSCCPSPPPCVSWSPCCSRRSPGASRWPPAGCLTATPSYSATTHTERLVRPTV